MPPLRLLHLSDIHFTMKAGTVGYDPDEDVRSELVRDLKKNVAKYGKINAVLISGDVAYSGKKAEYEKASIWINELCEAGQCDPTSQVYVCPGNHDVDQGTLKANAAIQDIHFAITRDQEIQQCENALKQRLDQPEVRRLLYASLTEYNSFAGGYGCAFFGDSESFFWTDDLELNDGSTLRIRGLNSALLSGLSDIEGSLFLSQRAYTIPNKEGVEYLVMCHHPPSWLKDGRQVENFLDGRSRIQLYGHEHDQRIKPGRDGVRLFAGAVHPSRDEAEWAPGYNIIDIEVNTRESKRWMDVTIHAREWQKKGAVQFRAYEDKDTPEHKMQFKLADWSASKRPQDALKADTGNADDGQVVPKEKQGDPAVNSRQLVYKFFQLPFARKSEIVSHLGLVDESDSALPDVERFKKALARAKDKKLIGELSRLVEEQQRG
jgi:predicted phosphohydrolase